MQCDWSDMATMLAVWEWDSVMGYEFQPNTVVFLLYWCCGFVFLLILDMHWYNKHDLNCSDFDCLVLSFLD